MRTLVVGWYAWLSGLAQPMVLGVEGWLEGVHVPALSAVLIGLLAAASPCQLTTNLGALAFSASRPGRAGPLSAALAFAGGKALVYSVVGGAVVGLGWQLQAVSVPVVVVARRLLGPLMLLVGLGMLGLVRLRGGLTPAVAERLRARAPRGGRGGGFLLGIAFAFASCPTLFWLFFGLTVPLALRSPGGWSFPGLFALGTALPLLAVVAAVSLGLGAAERAAARIGRWHLGLGRVAGAVFVLAGLHDTLLYWWL